MRTKGNTMTLTRAKSPKLLIEIENTTEKAAKKHNVNATKGAERMFARRRESPALRLSAKMNSSTLSQEASAAVTLLASQGNGLNMIKGACASRVCTD
jgi:hypothetical protein